MGPPRDFHEVAHDYTAHEDPLALVHLPTFPTCCAKYSIYLLGSTCGPSP